MSIEEVIERDIVASVMQSGRLVFMSYGFCIRFTKDKLWLGVDKINGCWKLKSIKNGN